MFRLPESLTIHNVKEIQEELLTYLQQVPAGREKEFNLDCSGLRDLDAAGLQLLLSAYKSFSQADIDVKITGTTSFVQHFLDLSGSSDILKIRR